MAWQVASGWSFFPERMLLCSLPAVGEGSDSLFIFRPHGAAKTLRAGMIKHTHTSPVCPPVPWVTGTYRYIHTPLSQV